MAIKFMHGDDKRKHKRGMSLHNLPLLVISKGFSERLLVITEAAMMERCQHPNICRLYHVIAQPIGGIACEVSACFIERLLVVADVRRYAA